MSFPSLEVLRSSFNLRDDILSDIKSAGRRDETNRLIEDLVLGAKLSEVVSQDVKEHPWLTQSKATAGAAASKGKSSSFLGCAPVGFMILGVRNVTAPKINPESSVAPRMLKLTATDGYLTFHLIELEPCNKLSVDTAPGTKIILIGDFIVRNNLILIKRNNVSFVGGRVEEMYEKWQVTQKMALKGTSREQAMEGSGAPKFVPFGCKIDKLGIASNSKKEEDAVKTEEDLKFDESREKKLEALKDLKSKAHQKNSAGATTTQLPDRDFFRKTPAGDKEADNKPMKTAPKVVSAPPSEPAVAFNSTRDDFRGGRRGRGGRNRNDSDEDGDYKRPNQSASLFDVIQNKMNEMSVTEKPKPGDNLTRQFAPDANPASTRSTKEEFRQDVNRGRGFSRGSMREDFSHDMDRGRGFPRGGSRGGPNSNQGGGNRYGSGHANPGDRQYGDRGRGRGRNQRGNFRGNGDIGNDYEFDENDYPLPNQNTQREESHAPPTFPESTYPEQYNENYYEQQNSYHPNIHPVPVAHDMYMDPAQGYLMHPGNLMQGNMQHTFHGFSPMPPFQQSYWDYEYRGRGPPPGIRGGNSYQNREFTPRRGRYNSNRY